MTDSILESYFPDSDFEASIQELRDFVYSQYLNLSPFVKPFLRLSVLIVDFRSLVHHGEWFHSTSKKNRRKILLRTEESIIPYQATTILFFKKIVLYGYFSLVEESF